MRFPEMAARSAKLGALFSCFPLLATAQPVAEITRPELKSIAAPAYSRASGIQLTESTANDLADLKVDMMRIELIGQGDAERSICYPAYDVIVDRLADREIRVLGLIDYESIAWSDYSEWATDAFRQRFVDRAEEIVTHYSSRPHPIRHWEIWNEEDLCVPGGYCPRIDPEPYGRILADAYHAIKAIDPGATVVLGGLSPKGFEYASNYLAELYATTALQDHYLLHGYHPFDVVGVHPYPEVFTAPDPGLANVLNEDVKAVMNANGDSGKRVWLTEMGWNSYSVSEQQQADYLAESYGMMDTLTDPAHPGNGPYVERYFWFYYRDFGTVDLWGLKTADLSREKPAYSAYSDIGPSSVTKPIPPPEGSEPGLYAETAPDDLALSFLPDGGDPLNGILPTRISGGFHAANSEPADQESAFTDGAGLGALTGLLADFPGQNTPAWSGFWVLESGNPVDLHEVRVFSGNNGKDGRVFHHYDLYVTDDALPSVSSPWRRVRAQIVPVPFGASNASGTIEATLTRVFDPEGGALDSAVTAMRLDLFSVSRTDEIFHDDWDACQGDDRDGADAAFESPLIYEVDAYFGADVTPSSLHVDSIVLSTVNAPRRERRGRAVVTVRDELGNPVSNASVTGTFTGDFSETQMGTTDANGVATLTTTSAVRSRSPSFQFCVDAIAHATLVYQPGDDVETCDALASSGKEKQARASGGSVSPGAARRLPAARSEMAVGRRSVRRPASRQ